MSFDVITKEHRPHPKLLVVVQKQLLLCHIESKISPAALLKRPDLTEHFDPLETTHDAISIHKLGLYPLNWLWRPPRAAELLGAACGGLLALISLREIKPSSPGLDPSNALRSCATHGQLDPTPWGPRALDPPVVIVTALVL